ncbi:MAG TPA: GTPase [Planctomycetota bacterium]|nr:GTPase [Planctomycetota bacterium]
MSIQRATYFAITTPQGTGGIGIIELCGNDALEIIGKIFRRAKNKTNEIATPEPEAVQGRNDRCNKIRPDKIYLGNIYSTPSPYPLPQGERVNNEIIDEVIIRFTPARNSLTGLNTVEINAHGGIMPCRLIGRLLKRFGVKELSQPEVINLARKQGKLDKIQAEALEYLLQAQTPMAAAVLLDQYNGALSKALRSRNNIPRLKETAQYGLALTQPKRILILGRPNVGKSTLFNALLGQDRAITHHLPGTTRDTIEDTFAIGEFPFMLVDTAGLRKSTNDTIEKIGMAYARKEIPKADVIVLVIEKNKIAFLKTMVNQLRRKTQAPVIIVANKADTLKIQDARCLIQDNIIPVSALRRTGIELLRKEILKACKLDKFKYQPGQAIIFSENILSHKGTKTRR